MRCCINAENLSIQSHLSSLEKFIESIPGGSVASSNPSASQSKQKVKAKQNEHFVFPFSTNYLAQAIQTVPFTHPDYAKIRIAGSLVSSKLLHKEIREKGGAYGGKAMLDAGGVFHAYSYRDPHINQTISTFARIGPWLMRTDNYTQEDIDEAKLQVFQSVDQPIMPSDQGLGHFLSGITGQMKQEYRTRLLNVTKQDIQDVADK